MTEILQIEHITKKYVHHTALQDVSMQINKGSIFGLLGPNGAGKTTLIRIVTKIIDPDEGKVIFNGQNISMESVRKIGYLPEERGLYKKMKVGEQLLYLARLKGMQKSEANKKIEFWLQKMELKSWWDKNVEDLSKGMQQKIQFIATVINDPSLIILDEPFSGFDPINANLIKNEILELQERGTTIIFSTHRMETVEQLCDHMALINRSHKILEGSKREIKNSHKSHTFEILYEGKLSADPRFRIINMQNIDGQSFAEVSLHSPDQPNILLSVLMEQVQILKFEEKIPSIQDIFIQYVNQSQS